MKKPATSLPTVSGRKLYISSPVDLATERRKAHKLTQYRREYWQGYKGRVRRVYGTMTPAEFAALKSVADHNQNSVWKQLLSDARAYRAGVVIAPTDILLAQDNLVGELRRIGNNINQLAKLGHIHAKKTGGIDASVDDKIGQECLRQFERLERAVLKFENAIPDYAASAFDPKTK